MEDGLAQVKWRKLEQAGREAPGKRSGHATCVAGPSMYMFGGIDARTPPGPNNELWVAPLPSGAADISWTRVEPALGALPPSRWRHSLTAISSSQLLLFGGFHSSTQRLGDTWVFDIPTQSWSQRLHVPPAVVGEVSANSKFPGITDASNPNDDGTTATTTSARKEQGGEELGPADANGDAAAAQEVETSPASSSGSPSGQDFPPSKELRTAREAPAPRGAHSSTVVGDVLFVFGGHGGSGYKRRELGDLQRYSLSKQAWVHTPSLHGGPSPRSGHIAAAIGPTSLLVHGGWNGVSAFTDMWTLDTETLRWSRVTSGSYAPGASPAAPMRWNAAAVCVPAVPYPQVFVFGGSGALPDADEEGQKEGSKGGRPATASAVAVASAPVSVPLSNSKPEGSFMADIRVLDTGTWTWKDLTEAARVQPPTAAVAGGSAQAGSPPTTTSRAAQGMRAGAKQPQQPEAAAPLEFAPKARADTAIAFDAANKRLVLWGGWANRWYGDSWSLPVAAIVGPPYCVSSVTPTLGPLTGGQSITVTGQGFEKGASAVVRFSLSGTSGRKYVDTTGTCISSTEIQVSTPSADHVGPGTLDARVSLASQPFSISSVPYTFFSVTAGSRCFGYGPGILPSGHRAGSASAFAIQARDTANRDRTTGADEWTVTVTPCAPLPSGKPAPPLAGASVADSGDGRYIVTFTPTTAGEHTIKAEFNGTFGGPAGPIRGSPFSITVAPVAAAPAAEEAGAGAAPTPAPTTAAEAIAALTGPTAWEAAKTLVEAATAIATATRNGLSKGIEGELEAGAGAAQTPVASSAPPSVDVVLGIKTHLAAIMGKDAELKLQLDTARALIEAVRREAASGALPAAVAAKKEKEAAALGARLDRAAATWEEARKKAPATKAAIAPAVKSLSSVIRKDLENFEATTLDYARRAGESAFWRSGGPSGYEDAQRSLTEADAEYESHSRRVERIVSLATAFDCTQLLREVHASMAIVKEDTEELRRVWSVTKEVDAYLAEAKHTKWAAVVPDALEDGVKALQKKLKSGGNKRTRASGAFKGVDKALKDFYTTVPLIASLRHKAMRPRHWAALQSATGVAFTPPHEAPDMLLGGILDLRLHEHAGTVEEIADQSVKEEKMEEALVILTKTWSAVVFRTEPYKESAPAAGAAVDAQPPVCLLKIAEDDFECLEADQLIVQGMMASRYLATFEAEITGWLKALGNVSEVMGSLADIQRVWSYLEPLFIGSDEVRRELPVDAKRFEETHVAVKALLRTAAAIKNMKEACNRAGLLGELEHISKQLEVCEKSLADFLDGKRRIFPRFYFVSKSDLLDILSNGSTPRKIMCHMTKVFLATDTLTLADAATPSGRPTASEWTASVGVETVDFSPAVPLEGKVEVYLQTVLDGQRNSLRKALAASLERFPTQSRVEWIMAKGANGRALDPAQLTLLVSGMSYSSNMDAALMRLENGDSKALHVALEKAESDLGDLVRLTQTNLSKSDRTRIMCLITLDAHGRDIIQKMILEGVTGRGAFQWQSQLKQRYVDGRAVLAIADARFDYSFEYLGNGPRLVVTPLTDRIYVTATQALNLKMGCAPAGPAGTGKTETTKDLANALAICIYVFNCSPEMDYKSLGNIFKGLAASGSWGCFDEFNRLIPEVLSVCSVQFKAVCDGIRGGRSKVTIEGDEVALNHAAGAFITMNPGYLGRSELPEGLKVLFRPITVMVPDLVLICENMLMAEGFVEAKTLASKFYSLYALLRELLSKQSHYDWGLRAIKSVLVVAGAFKRAEPTLPEQDLLMRALRDFNTPKIVKQDEVIFNGLLSDLFPEVNPPRKEDPSLEEAVKEACKSKGLHPDEAFCLKVVQLEEVLAIRHCVFVMGPPSSGKSSAWSTLTAARAIRKQKTKVVDLDPKVVTPEELYGFVHPATREWKDGVLSKIMRDLATDTDVSDKFIVLDGDIDACWIESMNSVMDDNRMLTLASNERIPLKTNMRMLFEIRDLKFASPATVSRAGIIYISTNTGSQWRSLIESWLKALAPPADEHIRGILRGCFERYVAPTLQFIRKECSPLVPVEETTYVSNLLRMLSVLLTPALLKKLTAADGAAAAAATAAAAAAEDGGAPGQEAVAAKAAAAPESDAAKVLETVFVFAGVWAFGGALALKDGEDHRTRFSDFWRSEFRGVRLPSRETVFDYYLSEGQFEGWKASPLFSELSFDSRSASMAAVTVPTPETVSISYWMQLLVEARNPVMLVGYAGCGKTQLVSGLLSSLKADSHASAVVNFNYFTDARALQAVLEAPLEKKTGSNYGPPGKSQLVFFLDDLNLPEVDNYDTQSAIALLRQHFDYGSWYDRSKLTKKHVQNVQYVAAMNPTAGSFLINGRLQRHFTTLAVGFPGATSLHTIYSTFLEGHLRSWPFAAEVAGSAQALLSAALQLHAGVTSTFRKSAANFHYEFNIRHLSSVFQGLLQARPNEFKDARSLALLWLHESERVYGDRLVSGEDVGKYRALAASHAKKKFPTVNIGSFLGENADPLVFTTFADGAAPPGGGAERPYDRVTSMDKLRGTLEEALREYNETFPAMELVLFEDALKHVARIARIIASPGGHALLVGVGGSGKQSLARLAAFMCGYRVSAITITGGYSVSDLREDLKAMYLLAGVKEEGLLFVFTDSQITNERFLVSMNDLLASGNIPDLFPVEEMDGIVNTMLPRCKAAGKPTDRASCWAHFIATVRRNLHVALCFSPNEEFRVRATRFPALVSGTTIDWFHPWPKEALHSVGIRFLRDVELGSTAVREGVEKFMPFAFESVNKAAARFALTDKRAVFITPKSYLELLKLFRRLLSTKRSESVTAIDRLNNGLTKLRTTAASVQAIEEELKVKLVAAEEKRVVADGIAREVLANKTVVEEETAKASTLAAECAGIAARANEIREDAERDLEAAVPAVQRAMEALNTLDKKDLGECRTMAKPPAGVDDVFAAVVVLLAGVHKSVVCAKGGKVRDKDKTWDAAKKALLSDVKGFLDALLDFKNHVDANEVPVGNWSDVREYLALPHFNVEAIKSKNSAAAGLCSWVLNIVSYRDIVVTVEPKKEKLRAANEELSGANSKLATVNAEVAELQAQLAVLTKKLAEAEAEKAGAEAEVAHGQAKAELATRLTNALADENVRWAENVKKLEAERELLVGDVLLATTFISYAGPFTKRYRDDLFKAWTAFLELAAAGQRMPMSAKPSPLALLTTEAGIATWKSQGLPDDTVSVENGAIVSYTERWPLLIDPQLQGIAWVREREAANGLVVLRFDQKDWLRKLELAIEAGTPVLIENCGERLEATLDPVLSRATIKKGSRYYLKLGDKEVEWNNNFRLYLHTRLANPRYPPEAQAQAALVNFTATQAGLEEQLLALTVAKERPDLASQKRELIKQSTAFLLRIRALEDDILAKLAAAEGDITEDRALIEGLENTKRIAADIAEKSATAAATTAEINLTAEKYRSVAHRAAVLFFLMMDLSKMHTFYIYSLSAFMTIFSRSIDLVSAPAAGVAGAIADGDAAAAVDAAAAAPTAEEGAGQGEAEAEGKGPAAKHLTDAELATRCLVLKDSATRVTFNYINRGVFERDKLTLAVQLCLRLLLDAKELAEPLLRALLVAPPPPADPGAMGQLEEWMPESVWMRVRALEMGCPAAKPVFDKLSEDMASASSKWRAWFDDEAPESVPPPGEYARSTASSPIHLLLLLRALRPDRLTAALRAFVCAKMGTDYVSPPPFSMTATFQESTLATPIFFVLFPGVDPTGMVEALGRDHGYTSDNGKFVNISMGQGQEALAQAALNRLSTSGGWLMLQNVHLMQSWLPLLERQLEVISDSGSAHPDFRCFISAEPPPMPSMTTMPESLMRGCIKVANEAPADLKNLITRSWASFSQERVDACASPAEFKACLFTLCFFHAVVLGRRKFGQMGWSRPYSFNQGDLTVCANVLSDYLTNAAKSGNAVPWDDLRYLIGEIFYGGHVTDHFDRRTNNSYLSVMFTKEILSKGRLAPELHVPDMKLTDYAGVAEFISSGLPKEGPPTFGLHANAEIGYLTATAESLLQTVLNFAGAGAVDAAPAGAPAAGSPAPSGGGVRAIMTDLLERLPEDFSMLDIEARAEPLLTAKPAAAGPGGKGGVGASQGSAAPFVLVCMQECSRMNELLGEVRRSLQELKKGLEGTLNVSDAMEDLATALAINQVPGRNPFSRASWERFAWPSRKSLSSWFADLLKRVEQLRRWAATLVTPHSVWLPGLFNPMAFLTAIMQVTARRTGLPLDKMTIQTHVTTMASPEGATAYPANGMYVHGLLMEGARWATPRASEDGEGGKPKTATVNGISVGGNVTDSRLKELLAPMPLLYLEAVPVQPSWIPSAVGLLRNDPKVYDCPVYYNTFRGPTYVFLATLASVEPTSKWTLAGAALVLSDDE